MVFILRPLWFSRRKIGRPGAFRGLGTRVERSLSARAVADRAGLAVLIIIPFKTERDLFPALAEPAVGHPGLEIVFADRAGQHGCNLHAHGNLNARQAV